MRHFQPLSTKDHMNASPPRHRVLHHCGPGFQWSTQAGKTFRGFTLLEIMVVLAIVAILATLAVPSFTRLIQSNTMSSNVNTFMADMRYARSESIRRGGGVVMCRSDAPEATLPVCNTTPTMTGSLPLASCCAYSRRSPGWTRSRKKRPMH